MARTVVLGASTKESRYSHKAVLLLKEYNHEVFPIGIKTGYIGETEILTGQPVIKNVDTITMYLSEKNQIPMYDYILSLKPKRIIFNPGSENAELASIANGEGIRVEHACTLVLLRTGQYEMGGLYRDMAAH